MVNEIGECAGKVWQHLNEHPDLSTRELAKALELDLSLVLMAVGWLAREDKIILANQGKDVALSLK